MQTFDVSLVARVSRVLHKQIRFAVMVRILAEIGMRQSSHGVVTSLTNTTFYDSMHGKNISRNLFYFFGEIVIFFRRFRGDFQHNSCEISKIPIRIVLTVPAKTEILRICAAYREVTRPISSSCLLTVGSTKRTKPTKPWTVSRTV